MISIKRARYYNPDTGRFLSEDPIGFKSTDTNLYRYVKNSPLVSFDPSGLDRFLCSRRLNSLFTPIKVGDLNHTYVLFVDSSGKVTIKSWGESGMIDEDTISTTSRSCPQSRSTSDDSDRRAMEFADTLGDVATYEVLGKVVPGITPFTCQEYSSAVYNY